MTFTLHQINKLITLKNLIAKGCYYLPTSKYYHYDFVWKVISIYLVTFTFQNSFSSCFYKLKSKIYLLYRITNWLVRSTNSKVNITFHTYNTIQFIIDTISKVMITFHTILLNQIARSTKILEERHCSSVVEHWMSKQVDWGSNPSIHRLFYLNCTRNFRKLSKR